MVITTVVSIGGATLMMCLNNTKKLFKEIATKTLNGKSTKSINFSKKKIDNEFVAVIHINKSVPRHAEWVKNENGILIESRSKFVKKYTFQKYNHLKTIAIILESPHIHEFQSNRELDNFGNHPALGKTGKRIDRFLPYLINSFVPSKILPNCCAIYTSEHDIKQDDYRVVLINLIQYQCSLGYDTNRYRDSVIKECLSQKAFTNSFKNEIKKYAPDVIINACTSKYKQSVWKLIDEINMESIELETKHPSVWGYNSSLRVRQSHNQ